MNECGKYCESNVLILMLMNLAIYCLTSRLYLSYLLFINPAYLKLNLLTLIIFCLNAHIYSELMLHSCFNVK